MLALCKPYQKLEFLSLRDFARTGLQSSGKRYYPEDHLSPSSRRWDGWGRRFSARDSGSTASTCAPDDWIKRAVKLIRVAIRPDPAFVALRERPIHAAQNLECSRHRGF